MTELDKKEYAKKVFIIKRNRHRKEKSHSHILALLIQSILNIHPKTVVQLFTRKRWRIEVGEGAGVERKNGPGQLNLGNLIKHVQTYNNENNKNARKKDEKLGN